MSSQQLPSLPHSRSGSARSGPGSAQGFATPPRSASSPSLGVTGEQVAMSPWRRGPQAIYKSKNTVYGSFYSTYVLDNKKLYGQPIKSSSDFSKHLAHVGFLRNASMDCKNNPDFEKAKGTKDWPDYLS
jgi:hypothetical protein